MENSDLSYLYNQIYTNYDQILSHLNINIEENNILKNKFQNIESIDYKDKICKQLLFSYILSYAILIQ